MNQTTEMILRMHNNTEEIGGIKFLMKNLAIYLPYITLTSIGTVIGVLGNLLIIAAILLTKELKKITNLLIFNLAVSDLMIAAVSNSFSTIGNKINENLSENMKKLIIDLSLIYQFNKEFWLESSIL